MGNADGGALYNLALGGNPVTPSTNDPTSGAYVSANTTLTNSILANTVSQTNPQVNDLVRDVWIATQCRGCWEYIERHDDRAANLVMSQLVSKDGFDDPATTPSTSNPDLLPLAYNAGPDFPETMTPDDSTISAVIDQGISTDNTPPTDENGNPRPAFGGVDLGAVELRLSPRQQVSRCRAHRAPMGTS